MINDVVYGIVFDVNEKLSPEDLIEKLSLISIYTKAQIRDAILDLMYNQKVFLNWEGKLCIK